jgi:hypothetical protein
VIEACGWVYTTELIIWEKPGIGTGGGANRLERARNRRINAKRRRDWPSGAVSDHHRDWDTTMADTIRKRTWQTARARTKTA